MFKNLIKVQLLVLLALAACSPSEQEPEVTPEENTECPYKLPWPSFLPEIRVSQAANDPTNYNHKPENEEQFAIDFSMTEGTPVIAARAGTLKKFKNSGTGHGDDPKYASEGNFVFIDHGDGSAAYYGHLKHLEEPMFTQGDVGNKHIKQGELIGF